MEVSDWRRYGRTDERRGYAKYRSITGRLARTALCMRELLDTREAAKALEMSREEICQNVRIVEKLLEVRLFHRNKGNRHGWTLVYGPKASVAWFSIRSALGEGSAL